MLEALHLTKIYKTKFGACVKALDDVSIQFPETGMVFLLGKSGSGKSTLLNVCGGLDAPTSGAIIVKGRSSNAFSQSDFDSYRNTYVGFIFQEYNILNEFTVEDNIALALELQGKPKDKAAIAKLLDDVDLTGYAKRKPNTLSGGQKQRIAIARALIKSPEIIMADEPTGALDSATGKQVFDTLKKLSKDKLVIVVSHDRDFAETYADRIIELKDGKVISDVTKTEEKQQELTDNVSVVGQTLCIKKGTDLSEEDFAEIKNFVSQSEGDVIIASGEHEVKSFKEVNHIKDTGEMEVFCDSSQMPVEQKIYSPQDSRFIRSKLPARHAFKIGASGLKTKPIRLAFTIMLCTAAFIFFGLLSTMTFYDNESTFKESLKDSNYQLIKLNKYYGVTETWYLDGEETGSYVNSMNTKFTPQELQEYASQYGKDAFGGIEAWGNVNVQSVPGDYWVSEIRGYAYLPEDNHLRQKIVGAYPKKDNEICISSYMADLLVTCKPLDQKTGKPIELKERDDIIGRQIYVSGSAYQVVGIIDSGSISEKYESLKEDNTTNYQLYAGYYSELQDGIQLIGFVSSDALMSIAEEESNMYYNTDDFSYHRVVATFGEKSDANFVFPDWGNAGYAAFSKYAKDTDIIPLVEGGTTPQKGQVVVSEQLFYELMLELCDKRGQTQENAELSQLVGNLYNGGFDYQNKETGKWEFRSYTKEEKQQKFAELVELMHTELEQLTLGMRYFDDYDYVGVGEVKTYAVVGVWMDNRNSSGGILFDDATATELWDIQKDTVDYYGEFETNYVASGDEIYSILYIPYDHSQAQTDQLWDMYCTKQYGEDGTRDVIVSTLISNLEMIDITIDVLYKVFLTLGIILAVFAALLLSNFISVSISYKKKEIGILRAVGARSIDVFKIFFSESFVITGICVVLSCIGSILSCGIINGIVNDMMGTTLFVFGPISFVVLIVIAFATAVIATFLPVWNAAKKKPVESIRAL